MPHLTLLEKLSQKSHRVDSAEAIVGRDPSCAIYLDGDAAKTVSGRHARFFFDNDKWFVEDSNSRNGTYVGTRKLEPGAKHALTVGDVIGLGLTGTQLVVREAVGRGLAATMLESSAPPVAGVVASGTMPMRRSEALRAGIHELIGTQVKDEVRVALRGVHSGARIVGQGERVTIGRALECLIRVEGETATSVSRVHSEFIAVDGKVCLKDNGSRHGTFVNGKKVEAPVPLKHGDLIMLGPGGPTFTVDESAIVAPGASPIAAVAAAGGGSETSTADVPSARHDGQAAAKPKPPPPRRPEEVFQAELPTPAVARPAVKKPPKTPVPAVGAATRLARASGVGRTALFRNVLEEVSEKSAKRVRVAVWSTVTVFVAVTGGIIVVAKRHMDQQDAELARASVGFKQQAATLDSLRASASDEAVRTRAALDSAMRAGGSTAVLDSLRAAVGEANRKVTGVEESMNRARASLNAQLSGADSIRRAAEAELNRLRAQVATDQAKGAGSRAALDSMIKLADDRVKEVQTQVRALKGADFPTIALRNQGAVGMVTTLVGNDNAYNGSGFVVTTTGLFLTNRHVVRPADAPPKDSIYVTMSDSKYSFHADVVWVAEAGGPDVAVLRIRGYKGRTVEKVDWTSTHVVQGEGAALIGFPVGHDIAMDETQVLRSFMSAGIFSRVTSTEIQFNGLSVKGSSGSPLFNGAGEVVALHRAGLSEGPGLGFAVPLAIIVPLLPAALRAELGIR